MKMEEKMNQETAESFAATAQRLAVAAETLERVLGRMEAQQEEIGSKVDRIVGAGWERYGGKRGKLGGHTKKKERSMGCCGKRQTENKRQSKRREGKNFSSMGYASACAVG